MPMKAIRLFYRNILVDIFAARNGIEEDEAKHGDNKPIAEHIVGVASQ